MFTVNPGIQAQDPQRHIFAVVQLPNHEQLLQPHGLYSMPGLLVPYHLPEFAQVHVYCIGEAIQRQIY